MSKSFRLSLFTKKTFFFSFQQLSGLTEKSFPLTVDTSQAIKMKPESPALENGDEIIDDTTDPITTTSAYSEPANDNHNEIDDTNNFADSYRRRLIIASIVEYRYKSLVLGMCAALIVFLFILTILCASQRDSFNPKLGQHSQSQQSNVLLNEVITIETNCIS